MEGEKTDKLTFSCSENSNFELGKHTIWNHSLAKWDVAYSFPPFAPCSGSFEFIHLSSGNTVECRATHQLLEGLSWKTVVKDASANSTGHSSHSLARLYFNNANFLISTTLAKKNNTFQSYTDHTFATEQV